MSFIYTPPRPSAPTPPGGSSGQVQYNNAGTFGGAAAAYAVESTTWSFSFGEAGARDIVNLTSLQRDSSTQKIDMQLKGGDSAIAAPAASVFVKGGAGTVSGSAGGPVSVTGGSSTDTGGGQVDVFGGACSSVSRGGTVRLFGGQGGSLLGPRIQLQGSISGSSAGELLLKIGGSTSIPGLMRFQSTDSTDFLVFTRVSAGEKQIGFFGSTPIGKPTTGFAAGAFVQNASANTLYNESTFSGYTIGQVIAALRSYGLLT